jgi:hypothetical protein
MDTKVAVLDGLVNPTPADLKLYQAVFPTTARYLHITTLRTHPSECVGNVSA